MRFPVRIGPVCLKLLALAFLALAFPAPPVSCGPPPIDSAPARPERIESWRIRVLSEARYRELRDAWKEYTERNPSDALGWSELAKAAKYAGDPCEVYTAYARKGVEVDPGSATAQAVLGSVIWKNYCKSESDDPGPSIRALEEALRLDPSLPDPHFTLWVLRVYQGDRDRAADELRALLQNELIPEPVVDFGYNQLIGLEPDAILLTNGDNDTYPALALQAARGLRADVSVLNVSLLNAPWYQEYVLSGPNPPPIPRVKAEGKEPPMIPVVRGLVRNLQESGWKRPLYVAVTVMNPKQFMDNRLRLEGLVYRVLPESGGEPDIDITKLEDNLTGKYRLDSTTSLALDWEHANAVGRLAQNYAAALARLSGALGESGSKDRARPLIVRALELAEFHKQPELGASLLESWRTWDAGGSDLERWSTRLKN